MESTTINFIVCNLYRAWVWVVVTGKRQGTCCQKKENGCWANSSRSHPRRPHSPVSRMFFTVHSELKIRMTMQCDEDHFQQDKEQFQSRTLRSYSLFSTIALCQHCLPHSLLWANSLSPLQRQALTFTSTKVWILIFESGFSRLYLIDYFLKDKWRRLHPSYCSQNGTV